MYYIGLLIECPNQDEHEGCPFMSYRKISFREVIQTWERLDHKRKDDLLSDHLECTSSFNDSFSH